jgi:hypothetical protein
MTFITQEVLDYMKKWLALEQRMLEQARRERSPDLKEHEAEVAAIEVVLGLAEEQAIREQVARIMREEWRRQG